MNIFTALLIQPLANGLILFYRLLWGNMGLAIIAFSTALRFLTLPLTRTYLDSMKKMKELEPAIAKLRERHRDDKTKLLQAQSELYKQKGVNPGAGCLPYLLQIVILIALFNVFSRALAPDGDTMSKFNELLYAPLKFNSGETLNTKFLYLDITRPDAFRLPGVPFPIPGPTLILAALLQFASAKIMTPYQKIEEKLAKRTRQTVDDMQVAIQQSMVYTFPLFTLIIGLSFPSGLALYWLLFSFWQFYQQYKTSGWGGLTPFLVRMKFLKD